MNVYTQADFDAIKQEGKSFITLPAGDWSAVDFGGADLVIIPDDCILGSCKLGQNCTIGKRCKFDGKCFFGMYCTFGFDCEFGDECVFYNCCTLKSGCKTGDYCVLLGAYIDWSCEIGNYCLLRGCKLGKYCKVGNGCIVGEQSEAAEHCKFGENCVFGKYCELGLNCELGDGCRLGECCRLEGGVVQNAAYFKVKDIKDEGDNIYLFCNTKTGEIFIRMGRWPYELEYVEEEAQRKYAPAEYTSKCSALVELAKETFKEYIK